jgi:hypothetical protein
MKAVTRFGFLLSLILASQLACALAQQTVQEGKAQPSPDITSTNSIIPTKTRLSSIATEAATITPRLTSTIIPSRTPTAEIKPIEMGEIPVCSGKGMLVRPYFCANRASFYSLVQTDGLSNRPNRTFDNGKARQGVSSGKCF